MKNEEDQIQIRFITWFRAKYPEVPTGMSPITKLSARQGKKMKAMGYTKGWPDVFIPVPNKGYMGIFIEFKTPKGKVCKKFQEPLLEKLHNYGYKTVICRSTEEAIEVVEKYFK